MQERAEYMYPSGARSGKSYQGSSGIVPGTAEEGAPAK